MWTLHKIKAYTKNSHYSFKPSQAVKKIVLKSPDQQPSQLKWQTSKILLKYKKLTKSGVGSSTPMKLLFNRMKCWLTLKAKARGEQLRAVGWNVAKERPIRSTPRLQLIFLCENFPRTRHYSPHISANQPLYPLPPILPECAREMPSARGGDWIF